MSQKFTIGHETYNKNGVYAGGGNYNFTNKSDKNIVELDQIFMIAFAETFPKIDDSLAASYCMFCISDNTHRSQMRYNSPQCGMETSILVRELVGKVLDKVFADPPKV